MLVSVIIPTRNVETMLDKCLESIKRQTYKNIEIIIVDCNSKDGTKAIAKKYTDNVYNFEAQGDHRCAQRNYGVIMSKGEYVFIVDSDMELSENVVKECVDIMRKNNQIAAVKIPEESFGQGFWAKCKKLERSFYTGVEWMEAARFFKKDIYLLCGGYDKHLISMEDMDFSQRVNQIGEIKHSSSLIFHDEGRISLIKTIKKRYYYGSKLGKYIKKNPNNPNAMKQTGIYARYKIFFLRPKKLLKNPIVGAGMLFMKTCEFGFGAIGYLLSKKNE